MLIRMRNSSRFLPTWPMVASLLIVASTAADQNRRTSNGPRKPVGMIAVDPRNPNIVFAVISSDFTSPIGMPGVWRSGDGGKSWTEGPATTAGVFSLTPDPNTPNVVYALAGDVRSFAMNPPNSVLRSTDDGVTWNRVATITSPIAGSINNLVVDPSNAATLYVSASAECFGPCVGGGILRSSDAGRTWAFTNLKNYDADEIAFDPTLSSTIYATISTGGRSFPYDINGLWKTVNGANAWSHIGPLAILGAVAIDSNNPAMIYAAGQGVHKSIDAGATWRRIDPNIGYFFGSIVVDPTKPSTLYASYGLGILRTGDGGDNWRLFIRGLPVSQSGNIGKLAISNDGQTLHVGANDGVYDFSIATTAVPNADFIIETPSPVVNLPVHFTDTSSGAPTQWAWTFGDATTSSDQDPTHTFGATGEFAVRLTAANDLGSSTKVTTINVKAVSRRRAVAH